MKAAVIYESATGNTAEVAKAIADSLQGAPLYSIAQEGQPWKEAELLFIGFWTDKGTCPEKTASLLSKLQGKKIALFGTAGFGGSQEYFDKVADKARQMIPEGNQLLGYFFCQGRMQEAVKKRHEAALEQDPEDERAKQGLLRFEQARTHPDQADLRQAGLFAEKMKEQAI